MSVLDSVKADLSDSVSRSPHRRSLEALALALAARIDAGDRAGMALPALCKELRQVMDALAAGDSSDEFEKFLADLSS